MTEVEVEGEVLAEEDAAADAEAPVRALPERYERQPLPALRGDVRTAALAAAGGALAGAATVAAVRVVGAAGSRRRALRAARGRRRQANVVATRSFLVDVHLLDR